VLIYCQSLWNVEDRFDLIGDVFKSIYARAMSAGPRFAAMDAISAEVDDHLRFFGDGLRNEMNAPRPDLPDRSATWNSCTLTRGDGQWKPTSREPLKQGAH
jgi:hypothetical protein